MAKEETAPPAQHLVGILERVRFSGANGFTVGELRVRGGDLVPIVGKLFSIRTGDTVRVEGDYIQDRKFGRQFQVVRARAVFPQDDQGAVRLLERLPFVGIPRASKWVKELGYQKLLEILEDQSRGEELEQIDSTFTASRRVAMYKGYQDMTSAWKALEDLGRFGLTDDQIGRALQRFGKHTVDRLHQDPFLLTALRGIGFVEADRIAQKMGFSAESEVRVRGSILYVLSEEEQQGHTYIDGDELAMKSSRALDTDWDRAREVLDSLLAKEKGALSSSGEGRVHLRELHDAEQEIFNWIGVGG